MSRSLTRKNPLVYFLCKGNDIFFNYADILKNNGYEVHIFDNHKSAIECCEESDLPDLMVTSVFKTSLHTWEYLNLLDLLSQRKNVRVPIVILTNNIMDVDLFVEVTGLNSDNFFALPADKNSFLDKVRNIRKLKDPSENNTVVLYAAENTQYQKFKIALKNAGFQLIHPKNTNCFADQTLPETIRFVVFVMNQLNSENMATMQTILQTYPEAPLIVAGNDLSSSQAIELTSSGVARVFDGTVKPETFLHHCLKIKTRSVFQKWKYQSDLHKLELEKKSALFQRVVESQKDVICKWYQDHALSFVNDAFCKSMNSNRKDVIGKKISDFIVPDGGRTIDKITLDTINTGAVQTFEHGYIDSFDNVRWYHWTCSPVFPEHGNRAEILAVGRNVSDMKKLEISIADSNAEMEILLDTVPNQIWYLSDADTYRAANKAHATFIGKSMEELKNCPIDKVYSPNDIDRIRNVSLQVLKTRNQVSDECSVVSGKGEKRTLHITQTPSLDEKGRVRFIICSATDVTDEIDQGYRLALRAEFEHLTSELISEFVQPDITEIDQCIQKGLEKIAQFWGVNRAYIVLTENVDDNDSPDYCWTDKNHDAFTGTVNKNHSFFMKQIENLEMICVSDTEDINSDATKEKQYFQNNRLKSLLIVPIEGNRMLMGYIVLESIDSKPVWETDTQVLLKVYGEALLNALQKARVNQFIKSERDFGLRLNFADSLDTWLNICMEYMMDISESDVCGIYLEDDIDGSMKLAVYRNLSERILEIVNVFVPDSYQYKMIKKGVPYYVSHEELQVSSRNYLAEEGFKSFAILPVRFREDVIACVNVASKKRTTVPGFTRSALETVVSRLGPLIAKARTDEAIRRNWENLNILFNSIKDYLVVTNSAGKILHINEVCLNDLGYRADDLKDRLFLDLYDSEIRQDLSSWLISDLNEQGFSGEGILLAADDRQIPVDIRIVKGEWQNIPVLYVFNHDLTQIKIAEKHKIKQEREMLQAQKMESLSRMAGAIAHHFNNLLMGVVGNLELARMLVDQNSRVTEKINQAEKASQRAIDLGKLMLMYVGQMGTDKVICNLADIVKKTLPLLQASAPSGVHFETELDEKLPPIQADVGSVQHILMNLASNSWESFSDGKGLIHIELTMANVPETFNESFVENESLPEGDYICLNFTDNGSGMDEQTKEQMFDPFFTTKFPGRGLGLSAVLGIVRSHQGGIAVFSEKDISTRISILFPPLKKETEQVFIIPENEETVSVEQKPVILLIDDENDVREVAKQMLENLGCIIIQASNGHDAIEIMKKQTKTVNGIVCDIKMPGFDGWKTMNELRNICPKTPIALVTGFGLTVEDIQKKSQPDLLIQKPYKFQNLLTFLKTLK